MNVTKTGLLTLFLAATAAGCSGGTTDGTPIPGDTTAPSVSSTIPANTAVNVALNARLVATFSEGMTTSSVNQQSLTVMQGTTAVAGTVSCMAGVATFTPGSPLAASTLYTVTVSTGARDLAGNSMARAYSWSFTTGAAADTTAPTVISTDPGSAATGVLLNRNLTATFSEAVDAASLTTTTFTLVQGTTVVPGTVTSTGSVATFAPTSPLAASTSYSATITTGAKDLAGNTLAAAYAWSFTTGAAADTTPPTVSGTVPATGATGVAINGSVTATFSEPMDHATVTSATFTLTDGATPVAGTVTMAGNVATLAHADLASSTLYTATITVAVKDLAGNAMAAERIWTFTTGQALDVTPPTVSSTTPADAATMVSTTGSLTATFSEAMAPATIDAASFTLLDGSTVVAGTVSYSGTVATFAPTSPLAGMTGYTATISVLATDLAGNALAAAHAWSFMTGAAVDNMAPTVSTTLPADLATGVALNAPVKVTFSEAMAPASITDLTFTLQDGSTPVPGTVTLVGAVATLVPSSPLVAGTLYTATVTTGVTDVAGNSMAMAFPWSFTAVSGTSVGPAPVLLGSASSFVILSKAGVTDVPTSVITGDVGSSPIAGSFIGLSCAEVTGTIYAVDATGPSCFVNDATRLTSAVGDMELAYTDAAGRVGPDFTELYAGVLDGQTLVPGLYKWGTGVAVNTDVTLSGGANDVWIFQIAGGLTVGTTASVKLLGGAQARNVFWQAAGGATINVGATVEGTILSQTAITMATGAVLNGRALAQTEVTLQMNTLTIK